MPGMNCKKALEAGGCRARPADQPNLTGHMECVEAAYQSLARSAGRRYQSKRHAFDPNHRVWLGSCRSQWRPAQQS